MVAASALTSLAQAQDFKIGIVNTDRILRDSNVAKAAQAKLESEFLKREKDLNDAITAFKQAGVVLGSEQQGVQFKHQLARA
eukprot:gene49849-66779_t